MSNNTLAVTTPETAALAPTFRATNPAADALALVLADSRSAETRRAYARDLSDFFQATAGTDATPEAVRELCALDAGNLALVLNAYKVEMRDRGLSEATVNRRLAAVRALLRKARQLGAGNVDPAGLVASEKVTAYRDTRGPGLATVRALLATPDTSTVTGLRDRALLLLLCENALRRAEVTALDVADFDPEAGRLAILGKGKGTQKEAVTLSPVTVAALTAYLEARTTNGALAPDAPLLASAARFLAARGTSEGRLTGRGLAHIVATYGAKVGTPDLHPHALRHTAITAALDATNGDVRAVQRLSRHSRLETLQRYDDNRADLQGHVTGLLSNLIGATA